MKDRIDDLELMLQEIKTELVGNPAFERIGIAGNIKEIRKTLEEHGKKIQKIENRLLKDKIVIGTIATAGGTFLGWLSKTWVWKFVAWFLSVFK